jgi:hypothetical protein
MHRVALVIQAMDAIYIHLSPQSKRSVAKLVIFPSENVPHAAAIGPFTCFFAFEPLAQGQENKGDPARYGLSTRQ